MDSWKRRVWQEYHIGNLTAKYALVLNALASFRVRGGMIFPSHGAIAARAGASISTTKAALRHGERLGLVSWRQRRSRRGWRSWQSSNVYSLHVPEGALQAGQGPVWKRARTDANFRRENERVRKQEVAEALRLAAGMPDLLAKRREAVTAMVSADYAAKVASRAARLSGILPLRV